MTTRTKLESVRGPLGVFDIAALTGQPVRLIFLAMAEGALGWKFVGGHPVVFVKECLRWQKAMTIQARPGIISAVELVDRHKRAVSLGRAEASA